MQTNATRAKLLRDEAVYGWIIPANMPAVVEMAGPAGLDFVFIDCEHGSTAIEDLEDLGRAADLAGVTPLVRVPANRPEIILRTLDRGMGGVNVPHIHDKASATLAVRSSRYAPDGDRGNSTGHWSLGISEPDVYAFANREILVCGMIEDEDGYQNLDDILGVPGLDLIHIGPGDISMSMGLAGQYTHPRVASRVDDIIARSRKAGKFVGLRANRVADIESFKVARSKGVRFFTLAFGQMATNAAQDLLKAVR